MKNKTEKDKMEDENKTLNQLDLSGSFFYENPFHQPRYMYSKACYETTEPPVEYKNYSIFHRIKHKEVCCNVFDVVLNGKIITQRCSIKSCKTFIDNLLNL